MQQFEEIKALLGDSVTYYLIAVDMDSNYSYLNKRYAQIFEAVQGPLLGKHYSVTLHPDDQQTCKIVSKMAFKYPKSVFPATLRKHDGEGGFIITRWEYKAMFDKHGGPAGIFCIGHDITELTQISDELKHVKYSHSHLVRRHVANLMGLGKLMNETSDLSDLKDITKMMEQSAIDLDAVIKAIYN